MDDENTLMTFGETLAYIERVYGKRFSRRALNDWVSDGSSSHGAARRSTLETTGRPYHRRIRRGDVDDYVEGYLGLYKLEA
jgi:hypothetical protein